ncbi:hypothetical protein BVX98_00980 [bacterium F11]|nr:hypothetical protein BVX98_00980 [bacterium F11]
MGSRLYDSTVSEAEGLLPTRSPPADAKSEVASSEESSVASASSAETSAPSSKKSKETVPWRLEEALELSSPNDRITIKIQTDFSSSSEGEFKAAGFELQKQGKRGIGLYVDMETGKSYTPGIAAPAAGVLAGQTSPDKEEQEFLNAQAGFVGKQLEQTPFLSRLKFFLLGDPMRQSSFGERLAHLRGDVRSDLTFDQNGRLESFRVSGEAEAFRLAGYRDTYNKSKGKFNPPRIHRPDEKGLTLPKEASGEAWSAAFLAMKESAEEGDLEDAARILGNRFTERIRVAEEKAGGNEKKRRKYVREAEDSLLADAVQAIAQVRDRGKKRGQEWADSFGKMMDRFADALSGKMSDHLIDGLVFESAIRMCSVCQLESSENRLIQSWDRMLRYGRDRTVNPGDGRLHDIFAIEYIARRMGDQLTTEDVGAFARRAEGAAAKLIGEGSGLEGNLLLSFSGRLVSEANLRRGAPQPNAIRRGRVNVAEAEWMSASQTYSTEILARRVMATGLSFFRRRDSNTLALLRESFSLSKRG